MILKGKDISLVPFQESMINDEYASWLNDPAVNAHLSTGRYPITVREIRQYVEGHQSSRDSMIMAIISNAKRKFIGTVTLSKIDPVSRTGGLGIMIGDKAYWGRGHGREAVRLLLKLGYEQFNLRKMYLYVTGTNPAQHVYVKEGFVIVGKFTEHEYHNGKYEDILIMEHFNPREEKVRPARIAR